MLNHIKEFFRNRAERRAVNAIASYWHKQGSIMPFADAATEIWLRARLQEFRVYASTRYLMDQSLTQKQIADDWIEEKIEPMLKSSYLRSEGKMLIGAIREMRDEMFFGEAAKLRREESRRMIAEAKRITA